MSELLNLSQIVHAAEIKFLNLSKKSDFTGLEKFPNIQDLKISNSSLRYFPNEIFSLKFLKTFSIDHNALTEISALPKSLTFFNISDNNLNKFQVGKLKNLVELDVSHNRLQGLEGISHLNSLKFLYCNGNLITSLHVLNDLELMELDVSDNCIRNIEMLNPVISSLQVVAVKDNPCCRLGKFQGYFSMFVHQGENVYYKKKIDLPKSRLLKTHIPTVKISLDKENSLSKLLKELEEVKEKNRNLGKKVRKLEVFFQVPQENERITEIEKMSFEDWRSGLCRYTSLKSFHAKKIKQLNYCKNIRAPRSKNRDFSMEQEKISVKLKKLFENI